MHRVLSWIIAFELVDAGAAEDRAVTCAIQSGLASDANEFLRAIGEKPLEEQAIGMMDKAGAAMSRR